MGSEGIVIGGYEEEPYFPCGAYLIAVDFSGQEVYVDFASLSKRPPSEFKVTPKQVKVVVMVRCFFAHYSLNHHTPTKSSHSSPSVTPTIHKQSKKDAKIKVSAISANQQEVTQQVTERVLVLCKSTTNVLFASSLFHCNDIIYIYYLDNLGHSRRLPHWRYCLLPCRCP
jgi:hypothetical protein